MKLAAHQKINHFHGMLEICRKKSMARNLQRMAKARPGEYAFFPTTFILPNDGGELAADVEAQGKAVTYILKPDAGCQGRGIRLLQGGSRQKLARALAAMESPNVVAQHYLPKPYLINGYKFDLRIYALVLSCDPLRIFLHSEGLARCVARARRPGDHARSGARSLSALAARPPPLKHAPSNSSSSPTQSAQQCTHNNRRRGPPKTKSKPKKHMP